MVCPKKRDQVVLEAFGTPDVRQIDGLGGADPLTGKVAYIGAPTVPGTTSITPSAMSVLPTRSLIIPQLRVILSSGRSLRPVMWPHQTRRAHNQGPHLQHHTKKIILAEFGLENGEFVSEDSSGN
jgi:PrpF protein